MEFALDNYNATEIARKMAQRLREKRLLLNLSQQALAEKSGVSLGSLKRFEHMHEISLNNLLLLAIALQSTEEFQQIFKAANYQTVDDILKQKIAHKRKRGRNNV